MSATFLSDLTDVLKNKYQGQINETTNYNTSMLDLFEESDKILMGGAAGLTNSLVVTFRTRGNKSATTLAQGAGVAQAQKIYYAKYNIGGATINGTCQFTLQASEAAPGDKDLAWMKEADEQTQNLQKEIAKRKDIWLYTGGEVRGLINTRAASDPTAGSDPGVPGISPAFTVEYAGSTELFDSIDPADPTTFIRVNVSRLGNYIPSANFYAQPGLPYEFSYASVANGMIGGTPTGDVNIFVGGVGRNATGTTLDLYVVNQADGVYLTLEGTTGKETVPGYAFGLSLAPDVGAYSDSGTYNPSFGNPAYASGTDPYVLWQQEANGALTNLFAPVIFGQDRSSGNVFPIPADKKTPLQSFAFTLSKAGSQARTVLTKDNVQQRFQDMVNIIQAASGEIPTMLVTNIYQKTQFLNVTTPTSTFLMNDSFGKAKGDPALKTRTGKMWDGTMDQFAFAGIRIGTSINCPDGLWYFWSKPSMKWTKTKSGGEWLTQGNGSILFNPIDPTTGLPLTQYAASWVEIYNTYCEQPHQNGVIVGMDFGQA